MSGAGGDVAVRHVDGGLHRRDGTEEAVGWCRRLVAHGWWARGLLALEEGRSVRLGGGGGGG